MYNLQNFTTLYVPPIANWLIVTDMKDPVIP